MYVGTKSDALFTTVAVDSIVTARDSALSSFTFSSHLLYWFRRNQYMATQDTSIVIAKQAQYTSVCFAFTLMGIPLFHQRRLRHADAT